MKLSILFWKFKAMHGDSLIANIKSDELNGEIINFILEV